MAHRVSKRAERDLKNIAFYIATESGSVDIAEWQIDAITERFDLLATQPEIGRARDDLGLGRRTFPVEHYVLLYRVRGVDVLILYAWRIAAAISTRSFTNRSPVARETWQVLGLLLPKGCQVLEYRMLIPGVGGSDDVRALEMVTD